MTTPLAAGFFNNPANNVQGTLRAGWDNIIAISKEQPGGAAETTLTISAGSVTPTGACHAADTEGSGSTDDLTNIVQTNHPEGRLLFLRAYDAGRTVVCKNAAGGTGQLVLADGDYTMDETWQFLILQRRGTSWYEVIRAAIPATATLKGLVELSTDAEAQAGTDTTRAVTPHALAARTATTSRAGVIEIATDAEAQAGTDADKALVASQRGILQGQYILLRDEKSAGAAGGDFTAGAWRTRPLNTEVVDEGTNCTLAANQFTLAAGTYRILASAPAYKAGRHQLRLRNVTAGTTLIVGTGEVSSTGDTTQTRSHLQGQFTVAGAQALELQHQGSGTEAVDGFGWAANFGEIEVYAVVELWRLA